MTKRHTNILWVVRHAAAEHSFGVPDFDRALRRKGERQVARMQRWLAVQGVPASVVVSSAATRAMETAKHVVRGFALSEDDLKTDRTLYGAGAGTLVEALRALPPGTGNAALVGHNPGISELISVLTGSVFADLPTCGIAVLICPAPWDDLLPGSAQLAAVATPDSIRKR